MFSDLCDAAFLEKLCITPGEKTNKKKLFLFLICVALRPLALSILENTIASARVSGVKEGEKLFPFGIMHTATILYPIETGITERLFFLLDFKVQCAPIYLYGSNLEFLGAIKQPSAPNALDS